MIHRATAARLALTAAALLSGCTQRADTGAVAGQTRKAALDMLAAYNAQDAHRAATFDAPDYVGLYHSAPNTYAMASVLKGMRNNRVPINDFAWATFYEVRKGTNEGGGGGSQTPTLPVAVSMSTTARF